MLVVLLPVVLGNEDAILEMKKLKLREVKSLAQVTQQAGTEVRAVWQPSCFPGIGLEVLVTLFCGYLYQGSISWAYLSPKDNCQGAGQ